MILYTTEKRVKNTMKTEMKHLFIIGSAAHSDRQFNNNHFNITINSYTK